MGGRAFSRSGHSPESTPRRQRNPLEDHLRTTELCTRCSGLHHRMRRVCRPGSWWCELTKGIVLYGDRSPCSSRRRRNSGRTRGSMRETLRKQKRRVDTEVTVLVGPSVTLYQGTRSKETRSSQKRKSLISKL